MGELLLLVYIFFEVVISRVVLVFAFEVSIEWAKCAAVFLYFFLEVVIFCLNPLCKQRQINLLIP
jgi:hypothetical protein